nr:PREDICTED: serine protease 56 [Latimeria chalumnae]|eukprot:XP_014344675.1 PREDICTED: serine protease 56 [Latimeria chalumnae]
MIQFSVSKQDGCDVQHHVDDMTHKRKIKSVMIDAVDKFVSRGKPSQSGSLSSKGTVILEAALKNALLTLEEVVVERRRQLQNCEMCTPCLFQTCRGRIDQCVPNVPSSTEPSCDAILGVLSQPDGMERDWALSKACGFYQQACRTEKQSGEDCVRLMGERCRARVEKCNPGNRLDKLNKASNPQHTGTCGRKTSVSNETIPRGRIIGGNQVAPGEWPWVVSIRLNGELMCGGVLVGRKWVITAAHCFTGNGNELYWSVAVGEYNLSKKDETEEIMQVNRIIAHPKFNQKTFNNDIALVELTLPAPVSDQINFVCLPGSWADPKIGTSCYITGWGSLYEDGPSAEALMEAKVPVLSQSSCKTALGKGLVTSTMFCAGYLSGGVDSCQGDSGGPLTCQDPTSKQHYLYGITSWGDGCGERGKPGIYTRVTAFTDWITQEIRSKHVSDPQIYPERLIMFRVARSPLFIPYFVLKKKKK